MIARVALPLALALGAQPPAAPPHAPPAAPPEPAPTAPASGIEAMDCAQIAAAIEAEAGRLQTIYSNGGDLAAGLQRRLGDAALSGLGSLVGLIPVPGGAAIAGEAVARVSDAIDAAAEAQRAEARERRHAEADGSIDRLHALALAEGERCEGDAADEADEAGED